MRNLFLATLAALSFLAEQALAADMPVKAPPANQVIARPNGWSGCYLGVEGGGAWGRTKQIDTVPTNLGFGQTIQDTHVNGWLIGGTAGCNYQMSNLVWGLEGDLSWGRIEGAAAPSPQFSFQEVGAKVSWLDTVRARIGYAADRVLWYVTGGAAFADVGATEKNNQGTPNTVTNNRAGWVIGGGVEWMLPETPWSVKVEYLYVNLAGSNYTFAPNNLDRSVQLVENIVRVGINYKFDFGKAPVVVTKY